MRRSLEPELLLPRSGVSYVQPLAGIVASRSQRGRSPRPGFQSSPVFKMTVSAFGSSFPLANSLLQRCQNDPTGGLSGRCFCAGGLRIPPTTSSSETGEPIVDVRRTTSVRHDRPPGLPMASRLCAIVSGLHRVEQRRDKPQSRHIGRAAGRLSAKILCSWSSTSPNDPARKCLVDLGPAAPDAPGFEPDAAAVRAVPAIRSRPSRGTTSAW